MFNPAEALVGLTLDGDWKVIEKINPSENSSGGNFSICYRVQRGEEKAFLKVWDLARALGSDDVMYNLQLITTAYNYELELLQMCIGRRMNRVVAILDHGKIVPKEDNPAKLPVNYFIFELADTTIREHVLSIAANIDNACLMRSLHDVAVGIRQLHDAGIAHQDLKGSNVLLFDEYGSSKVADLGHAEHFEKRSIYYDNKIAGDPYYAPIEQLYHQVHDDWDIRRKSTDLYQLGSLITFYYTHSSMTSLYSTFLPCEYHWSEWTGDYQLVLPYLKVAFEEALDYLDENLQSTFSDPQISNEILNLVKYLCDPDAEQRGHPENRMNLTTRYSMERFITIFDRLARKFESKLL